MFPDVLETFILWFIRTFLSFARSVCSSLPAFAACRLSCFAVNCSGYLALYHHVEAAVYYLQIEESFLETRHVCCVVLLRIGEYARMRRIGTLGSLDADCGRSTSAPVSEADADCAPLPSSCGESLGLGRSKGKLLASLKNHFQNNDVH